MKKDTLSKYIQKLIALAEKKTALPGCEDTALQLISNLGKIMYDSGYCLSSPKLEDLLQILSARLIPSPSLTGIPAKEISSFSENAPTGKPSIIFYDGMGFDTRGLAHIYLEKLCQLGKVTYISYQEYAGQLPGLTKLIEENGGTMRFITRERSLSNQIFSLNRYVEEAKPSHFFYYSNPDDVVATVLLYAYEGFFRRYQINQTDHAFWLGAGALDYLIEFRDYGATLSHNRRSIPLQKLFKLPFYPTPLKEYPFEGFPFSKYEADSHSDKKLVFSGGALYKTFGGIGDGKQYYRLVEHLLQTHQHLYFWYAGNGDFSEFHKLQERFPDRLALTGERKDLPEILKRCDMYLSTYPICGGLMFQYAALCGTIPLTLKHSNITDHFLLEQDQLGIEFMDTDLDSFYRTADTLLCDETLCTMLSYRLKQAVPTKEAFEHRLEELLSIPLDTVDDSIQFYSFDESILLQELMEQYRSSTLNTSISRRHLPCCFAISPLRFVLGTLIDIRDLL